MAGCLRAWFQNFTRSVADLWDYFPTADEFLLCMDLKDGTVVIAIFGMIYGGLGLILILSIYINYAEWKNVYEKKQDLLVYLALIFFIISILLSSSFVLLIGACRGLDLLVKIFLWTALVHVLLNLVINFSVCVYCAVKSSCFQNDGPGVIIVLTVVTLSYTIFWGYLLRAVNSFRSDCR